MEAAITGAASHRDVGMIGCASFLDGVMEGLGILVVIGAAASIVAYRLMRYR